MMSFSTGVKSSITYVISDYFAKMKVDSYYFLSLKKFLMLIPIKQVFNKDKKSNYHNKFLQKCSYELPKNNDNK